jgi:uncharacterized protein (DUF2062 family)
VLLDVKTFIKEKGETELEQRWLRVITPCAICRLINSLSTAVLVSLVIVLPEPPRCWSS